MCVSVYHRRLAVFCEVGNRLLEAAVAEHDTWDSAAAMRVIRFSDEKASQVSSQALHLNLAGV